MKKTQMVILAGGVGERFGGQTPKQFVKIAGKTIIEHTLEKMEHFEVIDSVIIVINNSYYDYMNDLILKNNFHKVKKIIIGGKTRQESSYAGICACDADTENVLFHDAIRPFVSNRILQDVVTALDTYDAVDVAIPCADTIIKIDNRHIIEDIPQRKYLLRGQTPQGFKKSVIEEAYRRFFSDNNLTVTDDCGIVRYYNLADIYVVDGEEQNIKITYKEDAYLADKLFQIHSRSSDSELNQSGILYGELKNKIGVVFGASSGIGKDIIALLAENHCKAYAYSRANGCDICDETAVKSALEEVFQKEGKIDYVINTAGELMVCKLGDMSQQDIIRLVQVDYLGAVNITKQAIPYLKQTKGSITLFTSSSYTRGRALYSIYSSTKAAIVNFMQAMAEELYDEKIRINVMNPERTDTPMRRQNFGLEDKDSLLTSKKVAKATIQVIGANYTGQVIDVRIHDGL